MNKVMTTLVAAIAVVPALTLAQSGPPQGGPPRGGPQGMRGPGMQSGPAILFRPDVQRELKLSESQIAMIREIVPQGPGGPGGPPQGDRRQGGGQQQGGGGGFQRGQGGPPQGGPGGPGFEQMQKIDAEIKEVLNDQQYKRYHELDLQLAGAFAVLRPDVAEKLKISDEQRQQIMEALRPEGAPRGGQQGGQRGGQQGGQVRGGQGGPPQGFDPAEMEKRRKEQEAKVLALLTDAQRKQWTAMLGKKFEFEKVGPPPGAPGPRGGGF